MTAGEQSGPEETIQPLEIGDPALVGRHRILGRLGTGVKYVVYLAAADGGDDRVAITMPAPLERDDAELRSAFRRSAASLTRATQPGAVRIVEDGTDRDPPFLVSDYADGVALDDAGSPVPLSPERSLALAVGLAAVLAERHEDGSPHGGVTPKNILLTRDGPRLVDYGSPCDAVIQIRQEAAVGEAAAWAAPERLTGAIGGFAADVFGWACVVAYAAAGRHPFGEGEPTAVAHQILFGEPDLSGVPIQIRAAVRRALAASPADRPEARELLAELLPGRAWEDLLPEAGRIMEADWAVAPASEIPVRTTRGGVVLGWPGLVVAAVLLIAAGLLLAQLGSGVPGHEPAPSDEAAPQPQPTATVRVTVTPSLPSEAKKVHKRGPVTVPTESEAPRAGPPPTLPAKRRAPPWVGPPRDPVKPPPWGGPPRGPVKPPPWGRDPLRRHVPRPPWGLR